MLEPAPANVSNQRHKKHFTTRNHPILFPRHAGGPGPCPRTGLWETFAPLKFQSANGGIKVGDSWILKKHNRRACLLPNSLGPTRHLWHRETGAFPNCLSSVKSRNFVPQKPRTWRGTGAVIRLKRCRRLPLFMASRSRVYYAPNNY